MTNWRKQQGFSNHQQTGHHRGSSFYNNRKPPLPLDTSIRHSTLSSWEKKFFHSISSIPWKKFVENQKYMHISDKVMNWEDSAVKEAFDNAKMRFWAKLNELPCSLPVPDPDIYIDKVDWDASVDPKLYQDLEREEVPSEEERGNQVVILGTSLLLNHGYSGGGWGGAGWDDDDEEEVTKPAEAAQGWEANLQENIETNSWEQHFAPVEHAKESDEWENAANLYQSNETNSWDQQNHAPVEYGKEYDVWKNESNLNENYETNSWDQHYAPVEQAKEYYEWQNGQNDDQGWNRTEGYDEWQNGQNDYRRWNEREKYGGGYSHNNKGGGRNGWNGNWGAAWDGNNRRENMTWSRNSGGYYGNEHQMSQMNRGRRNNRGGGRGRGRGRRGNFGYVPAGAW